MVPSDCCFLHSADEKRSKAWKDIKTCQKWKCVWIFECVSTSVNCNQGINCFCEISKRLCVLEEFATSNQTRIMHFLRGRVVKFDFHSGEYNLVCVCVCVCERKWERETEREKGGVLKCVLCCTATVVWALFLRCLAVPLSAERWWTILCYRAAIVIVPALLLAAFLSHHQCRKHQPLHRSFNCCCWGTVPSPVCCQAVCVFLSFGLLCCLCCRIPVLLLLLLLLPLLEG